MKKKIFLLLVSMLLLSCHCKKELVNNTNQQILHKKWMLTAYKNYTKEDLIAKNAYLDLTDRARATSKMGCNNLSFGYSIKGENILFSQGMSTRMFCQDMNLEKDFSGDIIKMTQLSIQGHQLTLSAKGKEKMVFIAEDWD